MMKPKIKEIFLYPIALILLFEEWGWEPLAALVAKLSKMRLWVRIETKIILLPPWSVVLVFGIPVLTLLPIKIFAIYLFSNGHKFEGAILLILSKILGTAFCARIFQLTKPQLMQIKCFSYFYPQWKNWKDQMFDLVRNSNLWIAVKALRLKLKTWGLKYLLSLTGP